MNQLTFNIPDWDTSTGLIHFATTWVLSKDRDGNDIVLIKEKDTENLTNLRVDFTIPIGEIYYIKALYHLQDSSGVEVSSGKWIGPTPIINKDTSLNEALTTYLYINNPYIKNKTLDPFNGITLELSNTDANVPINEYYLVLYSIENKVVYNNIFDGSSTSLFIPISELDFTKYVKLYGVIIARSNLGISSKPTKFTLDYGKSLFTIKGNIHSLSPYVDNKIRLVPIIPSLKLVSAVLYNKDKIGLVNCSISDYTITIPATYMEPNSSYYLEVNLTYVDNNNETVPYIVYIGLSTTSYTETGAITSDKDNLNEFIMLTDKQEKIYNTNSTIITEVAATGIIPSVRNNTITFNTLQNNTLVSLVTTNIILPYSETYKFEFCPDNIMTIFSTENDQFNYKVYKYDAIRKTLSVINTGIIDTISTSSIKYNNIVYNNKNFLIFYNIDGVITAYSLDYILGSTIKLPLNLSLNIGAGDIAVNKLDNDGNFLIINTATGETYIININKNTYTKTVNIPSDLVGSPLLSATLSNGNGCYLTLNDRNTILVYNKYVNAFNVFNANTTVSGTIMQMIKHKAPLLTYIRVTGNITDEVYRFQ